MYYAVRLFTLVALTFGAEGCSDTTITLSGGVYNDYEKIHYVRDGYSVEVFCSSTFPQKLNIFDFSKLDSEIINSTTIRTVIKVSRDYHGFLECRNTCASSFQSNYKVVQGDYYPKIEDFNCYSENFELLHCTWSAPNDKGNYSLSYIQPDRTTMVQICRNVIWYDRSFTCVFDLSNLQGTDIFNDPSVNLQLTICNYFGCVNQTYDVELLEITKLAPPTDLRMHYITEVSGETVLFFHCKPFTNNMVSEMEVYFVVEWLEGVEPRVLISESKMCYRRVESNHILNLPCPDKRFNLRVSCRPAKAPPKYMSDYAYTSFHTDPDPGVQVDPICKIRAVVETPPVMMYKTQLLGKYVDEEIEKFNQLKKPLADKAAVIRELQSTFK